jgi:lipoprotein-anchoring transpeptidase ErfK/SrfK
MPLLVPPPTVSEYDLHGLPPEALATSLKQEMSNWMRLHESNQEMKMMIQDTIQGKETSEGIRLSTDDVVELQKACTENVDVM